MYSEMADSPKKWQILQKYCQFRRIARENRPLQNRHFWLSNRYLFQKFKIAQFLTSMILASDFFFRRHKNLEHVQHDQRIGRVSQTAKIERPRDPSIESSSSVDTGGTRSSATLTCNGTVWTVNHVLILAEFLTTSSLDLQREKELWEELTFIISRIH